MFAFWLMIWLPTFVAITITEPYYQLWQFYLQFQLHSPRMQVFAFQLIHSLCVCECVMFIFQFTAFVQFDHLFCLCLDNLFGFHIFLLFFLLFSIFRLAKLNTLLSRLHSHCYTEYTHSFAIFNAMADVNLIDYTQCATLPPNKLLATCQWVKDSERDFNVMSKRWCMPDFVHKVRFSRERAHFASK